MRWLLGNSGAPRWYDCDAGRFHDYLDLLASCGATASEIVLHDGEADEFTSRVHVVRPDWDQVIRGYRDRGLWVSMHAPLTPEFSAMNWREDRQALMQRYEPVLSQVADISREQGGTTLVLHAAADSRVDLRTNEHSTAEFLRAVADRLAQWTDAVQVVIELRVGKPTRPNAAGVTRRSVQRIVDLARDPGTGICWDLAHDLENVLAAGDGWTQPESSFLDRVKHLHLHDLGEDGEPHCPPLIGRVPLADCLAVLSDVPAIMEIRWRMAARMGDPWDVLARSYQTVFDQLERVGLPSSNSRS